MTLLNEQDTAVALCRNFLNACCAPESLWTQEAQPLLHRSEIEWEPPMEYLAECGLAGPLLASLRAPEAAARLPRFFLEGLANRAQRDAVDDLVKREVLLRVIDALRSIGAKGVLLNGSAMRALRPVGGILRVQRASVDIDLYVEPPLGTTLRDRLLQQSFGHFLGDKRTAPHRLAPIHSRGVVLEIHESLMPSTWGLPEREMLATTRPSDGWEPLHTLSPEGLLLHAAVRSTAEAFLNGLKTGWDLLWICRRFPDLRWDVLEDLVKASRLPRAFWVPVRVLSEELKIPVPAAFLSKAPTDRRQTELQNLARDRLFGALNRPLELNPSFTDGILMSLNDL